MAIPVTFITDDRTSEDDLALFPGHADRGFGISAHEDGQLAVDVLETDTDIVLRAAIAAVNPDDLEVFMHGDMLTVRGTRRHASTEREGTYLVQECHWGSFSRSVILPADVDAARISAELKNGVLTVRMPKLHRSRHITVNRA